MEENDDLLNQESNNTEENISLKQSYILLKINLAVFLFYSLSFPLFAGAEGRQYSSMFAYTHAAVLLLIGFTFLFIEGKRGTGAAMILSSLILAVIGFSFCLSSINLGYH